MQLKIATIKRDFTLPTGSYNLVFTKGQVVAVARPHPESKLFGFNHGPRTIYLNAEMLSFKK